jgi:hypothetical protein
VRGRDNWPDHRRGRFRGRDGRFVKSSIRTPAIGAQGTRPETVLLRPVASAHDYSALPRDQHDQNR